MARNLDQTGSDERSAVDDVEANVLGQGGHDGTRGRVVAGDPGLRLDTTELKVISMQRGMVCRDARWG